MTASNSNDGENGRSGEATDSNPSLFKRDLLKMTGAVGAGAMVGGLATNSAAAASKFIDHGEFTDGSLLMRGWVGTTDGDGDVVLAWLTNQAEYKGRVGMIDISTGEIQEFWPPLAEGAKMYAPYASVLSSSNRWYFCDWHFAEFDPTEPGFTFTDSNHLGGNWGISAMSMTEDHNGVIWAACFPNGSVLSFDPETEELIDYGSVLDHPSDLFPRSVATDDQGWVYPAFHLDAGQIVMLNRKTGETKLGLPDEEQFEGYGNGSTGGEFYVYRGVDGKVYGKAGEAWFEFHGGESRELDGAPGVEEQQFEIASGNQGLDYRQLPSGRTVSEFTPSNNYLVITDPDTSESTRVTFTPTGGSAMPMGLTLAPNDRIVGGTYLPTSFFSYNPSADAWVRGDSHGQMNTVATTDKYVYFGTYPDGNILEWDPSEEWNPNQNPREVAAYGGRPYTLLAHPGCRYVILGGRGKYGATGKGLLFWDRETESSEVVTDDEILPHHSTFSLLDLPDGDLLGATTVTPARGGTQKADLAKLYTMDLESKEVTWTGAPLDGVESYDDIIRTTDREVIGVAERDRLFVMDAISKKVVYEKELDKSIAYQQGPEPFIQLPDGRLFLLFADGTIARVKRENPGNSSKKVPPQARSYGVTPVAQAPTSIANGGAYRDGRIYYGSSSKLYSWEVPSND